MLLPFDGQEPVARVATGDPLAGIGPVGRELIWAWSKGLHPVGLAVGFAALFHAVSTVIDRGFDLDLDEAAGLIGSHLANLLDSKDQGQARTLAEIGRLFLYAKHQGAAAIADITPAMALGFIELPAPSTRDRWSDPGASTQYLRRGAIRVVFTTARHLGLHDGDPTLDIRLPPKGAADCRPLTDEEELVGRISSKLTLVDTRHPVAWALGQAGATLSESATTSIDDVDLGNRTVWLSGNKNRVERHAPLTDWGIAQIKRRIEVMGDADRSTKLLTTARATKNARTASTGALLGEIFARSGLGSEVGIKPRSLCDWAGRRVFDETGRIEDAARFLGIRDLQVAADHVGYDWWA
ncbi:MAG TPA: hypothetical protein VNS19_12655 [Acidimicrobiales bacterium]|nr:hypothetical protein [Acidimicrobiales bacterium]